MMASDLCMNAIKACFPGKYKHAFGEVNTLAYVTYRERLSKAMELARLTGPDARAKLAKAVGCSVQAVGQVLTGSTNAFTAERSAKAARFLKVDHYWLATGEGEPRLPGPSEDALAFAARFDKLDPNERKRWELLVQVARNGVPDQAVERAMPVTAKRTKA